MGRRLLVPLFVFSALTASAAWAATSPLQTRAGEVRFAIPAAMAYQADHGTWRGMTTKTLQRYYPIKGVTIQRATRHGFCILTVRKPYVHFDGPAGPVRRGQCGQDGPVVPFVRPPESEPLPDPPALKRIRNALAAIEAYYVDNGNRGYAGMTIAALRRYDRSISGVTIVRATRNTYCIQSGDGAKRYRKNGPGSVISRGSCPTR